MDRYEVEYLVVGGVAARAYGAVRSTENFDCLVRRAADNLDRLAAAMRELNARLHVEGLSDEESKRLPVQLDARTISRMEISIWSTDAGDLDVLADMPARDGQRRHYEDLTANAQVVEAVGLMSLAHSGQPVNAVSGC